MDATPAPTIAPHARDPAPAAAPDRRSEPTGPVARVLAIAVALTVLGLAVRALADVGLLLFAAILMSCVLRGAAEAVGRRLRIPAGLALVAILVGFLATVALAVWLRGPALVTEAGRLVHQIRDQLGAVKEALNAEPWGREAVSRAGNYIDSIKSHVAGMLSGVATGTLGALGSLIVLLAAGLYFAISPELYVGGTMRLMPVRARPRGAAVLHALAHTLRWWFVGQALDMLVIGVLTAIGLLALGIPLWGTLAVIAALCNFVPYIGALAGSVPAILVALGGGTGPAISVAVLFLVVQSFEGNVVAPLIQKRTVELPPVITILSQTVLGTLLGPLGLILATPITAAAMVMVRMLYIEDVLGDRSEQDRDRKLQDPRKADA